MSDDSKKYTLTLDSDGGFGQDGMPLFERRKVEYDKSVGTLPRPRKVGFTFNGWFRRLPSLDKNELVDGMKYPSRRDLTYTAMWSANNSYTIIWMNGKTAVDIWFDKPYGSYYGRLPDAVPPSVNVEFVGWYLDSESSNVKADPMTMVERDRTWHARWRRKEYTIRFNDTKFKNKFPDIVVKAGDKIGELPKSRVVGYTLEVWLDEHGRVVEPTDTPTSDMTLFADWQPIEYTIRWNTSVRYPVDDPIKFPKSYTIQDEVNPPMDLTPPGYIIQRWNPKKIDVGTTGNTMFNAIWDAGTYIVSFDSNGGTYPTPFKSKWLTQNQTYGTLPSTDRTGYMFGGWYGEDGNVISEKDKFTIGANTTCVAEWTPIPYTIALDPTGGKVDPAQVVVHQNENINVPEPTRYGYQFLRWVHDGEPLPTVFTYAKDIVASAEWRVNSYTLKYNGNGAQEGYMPDSIHEYNQVFKLHKCDFKRTSTLTIYNDGSVRTTRIPLPFMGWSLSSIGNVDYLDLAKVSGLSDEDGSTVVLYAIWGTTSISVEAPIRQGWICLGFSETYESQVVDFPVNAHGSVDLTIGDTDMTLYGVWKSTACTIRFNPCSGYCPEEYRSVDNGSEIGELPIATKEDFDFLGWYTDPIEGTKIYAYMPMTRNMTLYAHWQEHEPGPTPPGPTPPGPTPPGPTPTDDHYILDESDNVFATEDGIPISLES